MKIRNSGIYILILIVAALLRLWNYFEIPYTHDEFSALYRTHFDSFSALIEQGIRVDGHPAGIQVFLYVWTMIFGYAEWIVKLPFVIAGIASIVVFYRIAKMWYNESIALYSTAFMASIQFTVMYSQIARPYISGLLFALLMVFYWSKLIKLPEKNIYKNSILFAVFAALCAYNHHFSLLFAAIVGLSGFFLIKKSLLLKYSLANVLAIVLYIPHIGIFVSQLKMGGIEGWLAKPENDFIINYLSYLFNFSSISIGVALLLFLYGLIIIKKEDIRLRKLLLFLLWFALPFLIGFYYSVHVNAVLQFSVLIFSFPFLYFVLFGHIREQKPIVNLTVVLIILAANIFSLAFERKHYQLFYRAAYENILLDLKKAEEKYSPTLSIIDSNRGISEIYLTKNEMSNSFLWIDDFVYEKELIEYFDNHALGIDFLYFGCMSSSKPHWVPLIREYYPYIEEQNNYAGGTSYVFSKKSGFKEKVISRLNFESGADKYWRSFNPEKVCDTLHKFDRNMYFMEAGLEWSPTYTASLYPIINNKNNFIDISAKVFFPDSIANILLVGFLESERNEIFWAASKSDDFLSAKARDSKYLTITHSLKLSDINLTYPKIKLNVFIWKQALVPLFIDEITIKLREGNPNIYGLVEKL